MCHTILIISGGRLVACDTPEEPWKSSSPGTTTVELTAECTQEEARAILSPIAADRLTVTARTTAAARPCWRPAGTTACAGISFSPSAGQTAPSCAWTTARASLEDIFIELTAGQADAQTEPLADGAEDEEFQLDDNALLEDPGAPEREDDET